jgi:hypothetical protein
MTRNVLELPTLVLNRNWQPVHVTTVLRALVGVRQSLEQKVGLSPADSAFRYQTDKDRRASEPVASRVRDLPQKAQPVTSLINLP